MRLFRYKVTVRIEMPSDATINKVSRNYNTHSGSVFLIQKNGVIGMYNLCLLSTELTDEKTSKGYVLVKDSGNDAVLVQNLTSFSDREIVFNYFHEGLSLDYSFVYPAFVSQGFDKDINIIIVKVKGVEISEVKESMFSDKNEFIDIDAREVDVVGLSEKSEDKSIKKEDREEQTIFDDGIGNELEDIVDIDKEDTIDFDNL